MEEFQRGIIRAVRAEGGLLGLTLEHPRSKRRHYVVGDNGPTCRALAAIFGDELIRGHALHEDQLIGKEIGYRIDELGLLAEITE
jgi:hypothetical protein